MRSSSIYQQFVRSSSLQKASLFELGYLDTFPVGRRAAAADDGNTDNKANSAQFQLKLPTGAELGNYKDSTCQHFQDIF